MVDHSIKDKTVLVTSGAESLSGLIVRDLATHGAKAIAIHYNNIASKADADATIAALQAAGAKVVALQGDLTSAAAMEKLFVDAIAAVGKPGVAINTIGKVLKKPFTGINEAEYNEVNAVGAKSASFFLREAGKHINDNGKICTLMISLLGAYTPYHAAYAGTKAPVEHFTRTASRELDARGVSVTTVDPGPMDTPFFCPAEGVDAVACHKIAAVLSPFSRTGLADTEDMVPFVHHLVGED